MYTFLKRAEIAKKSAEIAELMRVAYLKNHEVKEVKILQLAASIAALADMLAELAKND